MTAFVALGANAFCMTRRRPVARSRVKAPRDTSIFSKKETQAVMKFQEGILWPFST